MSTQITCFNRKTSRLCPGYTLVDTKDRPDKDEYTHQRVDACLFNNEEDDFDPDDPTYGESKLSPNWDLHRLHIEFKRDKSLDAFVDNDESCEGSSSDSDDTRAQIISYAALVFKYQHRCFLFTLLILGSQARIIRWDRAGAIVTERFDYKSDPEILLEFFDRFSRLDKAGQGYDTTVTVATEKERAMMIEAAREKLAFRDYSREFFEESLNSARLWWKVPVQISATTQKYFLVGTPRFYAGGMVGRGTRGYVALNPEYEADKTPKFVWLKDAWRVDHEGIVQEGRILEQLNSCGVSNVPSLVCHGDVDGQMTVTQSCWGSGGGNPLKTHKHYRMVVREVGRPLESFKNGYELTLAIYSCLGGEWSERICTILNSHEPPIAHMMACTEASILHRDVSIGNMIIVEPECGSIEEGPQGFLTDWELSKPLKEKRIRQQHRTVSCEERDSCDFQVC